MVDSPVIDLGIPSPNIGLCINEVNSGVSTPNSETSAYQYCVTPTESTDEITNPNQKPVNPDSLEAQLIRVDQQTSAELELTQQQTSETQLIPSEVAIAPVIETEEASDKGVRFGIANLLQHNAMTPPLPEDNGWGTPASTPPSCVLENITFRIPSVESINQNQTTEIEDTIIDCMSIFRSFFCQDVCAKKRHFFHHVSLKTFNKIKNTQAPTTQPPSPQPPKPLLSDNLMRQVLENFLDPEQKTFLWGPPVPSSPTPIIDDTEEEDDAGPIEGMEVVDNNAEDVDHNADADNNVDAVGSPASVASPPESPSRVDTPKKKRKSSRKNKSPKKADELLVHRSPTPYFLPTRIKSFRKTDRVFVCC